MIFTKQEKIKIVEEFFKSGLTKTQFCRQKNIGVSTFCGWVKKSAEGPKKNLLEKSEKISFVKAKIYEDKPILEPTKKTLVIYTSYGRIEVPL